MVKGTAPGLLVGDDRRKRCWWCGEDPLYRAYHDDEWGRPSSDDRRLFEKLSLEGFQSGLSWLTILRKRENFRRAFKDFDHHAIARFTPRAVERLLTDPGIVRHRGKIEAVITNARRMGELFEQNGSLAAFVWRFEPSAAARPQVLDQATLMQMAKTPESIALSKELKRGGWAYVGPTTVYSFMQAMGIVNDHIEGCYRRREVERERRAFARPEITWNNRLSPPAPVPQRRRREPR